MADKDTQNLRLSGITRSQNDQQVLNDLNTKRPHSQTLRLASGVFTDYRPGAHVRRSTHYDQLPASERSAMLEKRQSQFMNKLNDTNYAAILTKFEQSAFDRAELNRLRLHSIQTPPPVVYYPKTQIIKKDAAPASEYSWAPSSRVEALKTAGGFEDILLRESMGQSKILPMILEKRGKTSLQQKLQREKLDGTLSMSRMLLTKPQRPRSLSMHERSELILHPERFAGKNVDYAHDSFTHTLLRFAQEQHPGASAVQRFIQ